jgi:ribosome-associated protein
MVELGHLPGPWELAYNIAEIRVIEDKGGNQLDSLQIARDIVDIVVGKLAVDTLLLDMREVTIIADYFLICSAGTDRQIQALTEDVREGMKEKGVKPWSVEGSAESGWVLMDYSDVIVHIMHPDTRKFYDLEGLWKKAKTVVRIE